MFSNFGTNGKLPFGPLCIARDGAMELQEFPQLIIEKWIPFLRDDASAARLNHVTKKKSVRDPTLRRGASQMGCQNVWPAHMPQ